MNTNRNQKELNIKRKDIKMKLKISKDRQHNWKTGKQSMMR